MTRLNESESAPSVQEEIFKTLLRTPHRSVDEVLSIHRDQLQRDPFLYGCLAVYAVVEGQCAVRDIQDVFIATLFVSEFSEHRSAAWAMFQDLPPFRARRVVRYVTGYAEIVRHTSQDKKPLPEQGFGLSYARATDRKGKEIPRKVKKIGREMRKHVGNVQELTIDTYLMKHEAHGKRLNRFAASAIESYLKFREDNEEIMVGAILRAKDALKFLYAKAHLLPGQDENSWVNQCLFHDVMPEGSRLEAKKKLAACKDPTEQAKLIMDSKLPFPVVQSLIETITPSVLIALIDSMSPQELLGNLAKLKREGAFNSPEIKELVQSKIKKAKTTKKGKVDAFKGEIAAEAVKDLDEATKALVSEVTDAQLKHHGKISVSTALMIDKSYSLQEAIEEGKRIAAALAQAGGDNFAGCYLFDSSARLLKWTKSDGDMNQYSAWKKKFSMMRAGGGTDPVACLQAMIRSKTSVEQIVMVTDEDENNAGRFASGLVDYKAEFGHIPDIVIVRLGLYACDKIEKTCKKVGANVSVMNCTKTDKIALPNLIQLCSKRSTFDLVQEILELPLPTREEWVAKSSKKTKRNRSGQKLAGLTQEGLTV